MSTPVILTEKLRRPEVLGLARRRLEGPLLDRTTGRLDLVVAPPGSGKTTLLARVAAGAATEMPVAWYRVTADDSSEIALIAHLGRALQKTLGICVVENSTSALLEALEDWSGPRAMVILDDLHEIAGTAAERAVQQFIELRPQHLRVLVGARRQPELNIPRLRVSGLLQEISSDDLRFRSWEVEELFISIFREPLSPESAAALTRRTGGWAAGLQLFHLATTGRSPIDRQRAVEDLGGRSKLVRSYLARNVLAELPEERREFLLKTCTLGTLTGTLCDSLLETTGSSRVLDELEQRQLFTSSEDDGETFRYHEVLRTHLEWALVEEFGAAGARRWYSRSAALLESIGDQRGAVRAFARAEDWGAVARIIQSRGSGPNDAVTGADLLLPPAVVQQDPWLSLAEARRRVREGALGAAADAFRQAEGLLDEPDFRESCRRERSVAAMWSAGRGVGPSWPTDTRAESQHWSVPIRLATQRATPTPATAPAAGHGSARSALSATAGRHNRLAPGSVTDAGERLGRGVAALLSGDFRWAQTVLDAVEQDRSADPTHRLLAQLASTVIELVTVGCADPSARLGQIALDAELAGLPWVARLSRGLGEAVLVALGSPAWRLDACVDLLGECEQAGDDWGAAILRLAVAIAGQVAEPTVDHDEFADAATRFRRLDAPVLALWAESLQACVLARTGAGNAAEFARRVAAQARAAGLGAAQAVALAALAMATGNGRSSEPAMGDTASGVRGALLLLADSFGPAGRKAHTFAEDPSSVDGSSGAVTSEPATSGAVTSGAVTSGAVTSRAVAATTESAVVAPAPLLDSTETELVQPVSRVPAENGVRRPVVQIRCFGGFGIEIDGMPVDLTPLRPRARALLRLLALTPDRDAHRERLVDALWPGVDLIIGTRRLQVAVSSVRQALEQAGLSGSDVLARHGDAYRLALPPGSTVDVQKFEQGLRDASASASRGDTLASMAARESALSLYRGELLPEDGPADYVVDERERLRLAAASAAAALAQDSHDLGHPRQALAAARLSVQLDRFQDLAWELLVDLHEAAGDNSAAERARREHARAQAELDDSEYDDAVAQ